MAPVRDLPRPPFFQARLRELAARERAKGHSLAHIAGQLQVSEGELLAAHAGAHGAALHAVPLRGPWLALLQSLQPCGALLAQTGNRGCQHVKTGIYERLAAPAADTAAALPVRADGPADLRPLLRRWHAGYALTEAAPDPARPTPMSLRFYDAHGAPVHAIHACDDTDRQALQALVAAFAAPTLGFLFRPAPAAVPPKPDAFCDAAALHAGWSALRDPREFAPLLARLGIERQQALRLMHGEFAHRLGRSGLRLLLAEAAGAGIPLRIAVGNAGCVQAHEGAVRQVEPAADAHAPSLQVGGDGFALRLREDRIAQVWLLERPAAAGGVLASVEAYDLEGSRVVTLHAAGVAGTAAGEAWRALAHGVARRGRVRLEVAVRRSAGSLRPPGG